MDDTWADKNYEVLAREQWMADNNIECQCELCDEYGYDFPVRCEDCDAEVHGSREDIDIRVWSDPDHEEIRCLYCTEK